MKLAVMGASGFVGSRILEMFHLGRRAEVRPIVRSFGALARVARFDLDWRLADARDQDALTAAFEGCEFAIHSVHGQPDIIEDSIGPTYRAAQKAGVRRLIYLSSASVHGQAPAPGTDEKSQLSDHQAEDYNNRKVRAERLLIKERARGSVEVVIFRPGIVFGPRDRWISTLADELLHGTAYLVEGGKGICNSIYVDNLVQAIGLGMTVEKADGEVFLVGDREEVTWVEFYRSVADGLGYPFDEIHHVEAPVFRKEWLDRINEFRSAAATQAALPWIPSRLKRMAKGALAGWSESIRHSPWLMPGSPVPTVRTEMALLHRCPYKLPFDKARGLLGYEPETSFEDGMNRSLAWLAFAGYPVRKIGRQN